MMLKIKISESLNCSKIVRWNSTTRKLYYSLLRRATRQGTGRAPYNELTRGNMQLLKIHVIQCLRNHTTCEVTCTKRTRKDRSSATATQPEALLCPTIGLAQVPTCVHSLLLVVKHGRSIMQQKVHLEGTLRRLEVERMTTQDVLQSAEGSD